MHEAAIFHWIAPMEDNRSRGWHAVARSAFHTACRNLNIKLLQTHTPGLSARQGPTRTWYNWGWQRFQGRQKNLLTTQSHSLTIIITIKCNTKFRITCSFPDSKRGPNMHLICTSKEHHRQQVKDWETSSTFFTQQKATALPETPYTSAGDISEGHQG